MLHGWASSTEVLACQPGMDLRTLGTSAAWRAFQRCTLRMLPWPRQPLERAYRDARRRSHRCEHKQCSLAKLAGFPSLLMLASGGPLVSRIQRHVCSFEQLQWCP